MARVDAVWDDAAGVWVATSDDIPGLVVEAQVVTELNDKIALVARNLDAGLSEVDVYYRRALRVRRPSADGE